MKDDDPSIWSGRHTTTLEYISILGGILIAVVSIHFHSYQGWILGGAVVIVGTAASILFQRRGNLIIKIAMIGFMAIAAVLAYKNPAGTTHFMMDWANKFSNYLAGK